MTAFLTFVIVAITAQAQAEVILIGKDLPVTPGYGSIELVEANYTCASCLYCKIEVGINPEFASIRGGTKFQINTEPTPQMERRRSLAYKKIELMKKVDVPAKEIKAITTDQEFDDYVLKKLGQTRNSYTSFETAVLISSKQYGALELVCENNKQMTIQELRSALRSLGLLVHDL